MNNPGKFCCGIGLMEVMNQMLIQGGSGPAAPYADIVGVNTTAGGQQVFLTVGDSIAQGSNNATGPGPTPTAGTVKQYNASNGTIIDIGATDVANRVANGGTFMPRCGINYNAATGKIPVFVSNGVASAFFEDNGAINWSAAGALRAQAETNVTTTLGLLGLTKLKGIYVILGINSARGVADMASVVLPACDDFFLWLTTTYPGVPIIVCQIGRHDTAAHNDRIYGTRLRIIQNAITYPDVHIGFAMASMISAGGMASGDLYHPLQVGNNSMGESFARWWGLSSYSKWPRSVMASLYADLTTTRKDAIETFFTAIGSDYFKFENFHWFKVTGAGSVFVDWSFLGYNFDSSANFTENSHVATDGSTDHYSYAFYNSVNIGRANQDDFFTIVKVKTNNTPQGTLAYLFGSNSGTLHVSVGQTTTPNIAYRCNDATASTSPETVFANNTVYGIARNGTTKAFLKNTAVLNSAVVASTGNITIAPLLGGRNGAGTPTNRIAAEFICLASGKYSTINMPNLVNAINALEAAW